MFLTLNNEGTGFNQELKSFKDYDFFFLSSDLSGDFITLSDKVSFKVFNDCLACSLKRNKSVFILNDSSRFDKEWIELIKQKDIKLHEDFIYIGVNLREKLLALTPTDSEKISLKVLSNNYSQL
ncbi:hypothetical protein [Halobacteriovorax sp. HLS]|uniref:hypothetical protein n=1 Tax=Halobacteriovorax sp. HLS TaxID=2234000 RepID=UPI000FD79D91|nr:hypothetical protein [Halobacteriovorax sp. HLS]